MTRAECQVSSPSCSPTWVSGVSGRYSYRLCLPAHCDSLRRHETFRGPVALLPGPWNLYTIQFKIAFRSVPSFRSSAFDPLEFAWSFSCLKRLADTPLLVSGSGRGEGGSILYGVWSGPVLWLEGEGQSSFDPAAAAERVGSTKRAASSEEKGGKRPHLFVSVPDAFLWLWTVFSTWRDLPCVYVWGGADPYSGLVCFLLLLELCHSHENKLKLAYWRIQILWRTAESFQLKLS